MKNINYYTNDTGFMMHSQLKRLLFLTCLLLLASLLRPVTVSAQDDNFCAGNCTSGDIRITRVEIVNSSGGALPAICDEVTSVPVKLKVYFNVISQTRYGFLVTADVYVGGSYRRSIADCTGGTFTKGNERFFTIDDPVNWTCGESIELRNVFTAWENAAPSTKSPSICTRLVDDKITDCAPIRPKCYYYGSTSEDAIGVITPVQSGFTVNYGGCTDNMGNPIVFKPISFSATGSGGTAPYSYQWVVRDSVQHTVLAVSSISSNSSYTYTPITSNNLSVKVIVRDSSSPTKTTSTTRLVTVASCCTSPTITSAPAPQTKCEGEKATFTVASSGGSPTTGVQWQVYPKNGSAWSDINGANSTTFEISAVTTAMDGNKYRAVLTSGACEPAISGEASLSVNAVPAAPTVGAQAFCSSAGPTVAALPNGGNTYKWYTAETGGTALSGSTSLSTGIYWVSVTTNNCESARSSVSVVVSAPPTTATVGTDQERCGTLTSAGLGGNAPTVGTGLWTKKSGPGTVEFSNANSGSSTATVSSAGIYVFTWTISNSPCAASAADITVTFLESPAAPTSPNSQTVCQTSPTHSLTASVTVPANTTVVWYDAATGGKTVDDPTLTGAGVATYYAEAVKDGCSSATRTAVRLEIKATPGKPVASATQQPTCSVNSGSIAVTDPNENYTYSLSGGPTAKDPNNTGIFSGLAPGDYTITATLNGCPSAASDAIAINASQGTPAMPTVTVKTAASCSSSKIVLEVTGPTPLDAYEFQNNGGKWTTDNLFTIKAGEGYSIKARRVSDKTCESPAATCAPEEEEAEEITATSTSSIQSLEKATTDELRAYPIPFSDRTTVEFRAAQDGEYVINLYDMKGMLVRQLKAGTARAGELTQVEVDGQKMPEGMYLARMVSPSGAKTVKLLKRQ